MFNEKPIMWLCFSSQFEKERQEAEEMKREMGLGEQDDSLAMILKVKHA